MIDQEHDPEAVHAALSRRGIARPCYGYGDSIFSTDAEKYRGPIERATWMRARNGAFHFVYIWTVNSPAYQAEYIRIGVDGVLTEASHCASLVHMVRSDFASEVHLAARGEAAFEPLPAYALSVRTGEDGTDSHVTFTVHGSAGSASTTVNTRRTGRMEDGQTNYVVLSAPDLGELTSVTVEHDSAGINSDWFIEEIEVESVRMPGSKRATFELDLDANTAVTRPLV